MAPQTTTFAGGRVEHHQINSKVLADAGIANNQKETSVYLPEEYDTSELAYPALYLLHGGWWGRSDNKTFLGSGYGGTMSNANAPLIADRLIESGTIEPMIIVIPDMNLSKAMNYSTDMPLATNYIRREVIPLVDSTYRTIGYRDGRAIAGHSDGGHGATFIGLSAADMFSLVGAYSETLYSPHKNLVFDHNQTLYPLYFWIYVGRNDGFGLDPLVRQFVQWLEEASLPYLFVDDDGNHTNRIAQRLEESLIFFSERLGGGIVSVESQSKLSAMWGGIKLGR